MKSGITTPEQYIESVPEERKEVFLKLRNIIKENIPEGFKETINYGMIGYVVPHSIYPKGYHCDPKLPLPFINIACQKNYISIYHLGLYSDNELLNWFLDEFVKVCKYKLDMGKSCIRFRPLDDIPYGLIGDLVSKITVSHWIGFYERSLKKTSP